MTSATAALNGLWKANMETAQKYAQLALDSTEQLFKTQAESLRDICDLGSHEYLNFWSGNSGRPLDHLPEMFTKRLDFAVGITRQYQDTSLQFQNALNRITEKQMPIIKKEMEEAINAALTPTQG